VDQSSLTNKEKAVISAVTSAVTAAVGYGVLPTGTVQVVDLIGSAVLAVTAAYFAVRHLINPTA
jgi:hypothetical protein